MILTASAIASWGYLSLPKIMIIAFLGTTFADWSCFYVGRYYRKQILERFPKYQAPAEKAYALLHKWDILKVISSTFL